MENSNFDEDCSTSGWGYRIRKPNIVWEPTLGSTIQLVGLYAKNSGKTLKRFSSENISFVCPASHSCCQVEGGR